MRKIIPLTVVVLGFGAGAAAAQERQWTLDVSDTDAYLAFGVPETDDIGVSLWCPLHAGEIRIFLPETDGGLKPDRKVTFTLTIDGKWYRIPGSTKANEMSGGVSIEGARAASDPLFAALAKADRFTLSAGKQQLTFPLIEADVSGLIADCAKN